MFVVFNKEYRKINSIMNNLINKVRNSAKIMCTYEDDTEFYKLDTVDIVFVMGVNNLIVKDKEGNGIISIDCHYDCDDELQLAKWRLCKSFIKKVREEHIKKIEQATRKAASTEDSKQWYVSLKLAKEKMLNDALTRLRGL